MVSENPPPKPAPPDRRAQLASLTPAQKAEIAAGKATLADFFKGPPEAPKAPSAPGKPGAAPTAGTPRTETPAPPAPSAPTETPRPPGSAPTVGTPRAEAPPAPPAEPEPAPVATPVAPEPAVTPTAESTAAPDLEEGQRAFEELTNPDTMGILITPDTSVDDVIKLVANPATFGWQDDEMTRKYVGRAIEYAKAKAASEAAKAAEAAPETPSAPPAPEPAAPEPAPAGAPTTGTPRVEVHGPPIPADVSALMQAHATDPEALANILNEWIERSRASGSPSASPAPASESAPSAAPTVGTPREPQASEPTAPAEPELWFMRPELSGTGAPESTSTTSAKPLTPEARRELLASLDPRTKAAIAAGKLTVAQVLAGERAPEPAAPAVRILPEDETPEPLGEIIPGFSFGDLYKLDGNTLYRLGLLGRDTLALALRGSAGDTQEKIAKALDPENAYLKKEMAELGPQKLSDIESAQRKILQRLREMQDEKEVESIDEQVLRFDQAQALKETPSEEAPSVIRVTRPKTPAWQFWKRGPREQKPVGPSADRRTPAQIRAEAETQPIPGAASSQAEPIQYTPPPSTPEAQPTDITADPEVAALFSTITQPDLQQIARQAIERVMTDNPGMTPGEAARRVAGQS